MIDFDRFVEWAEERFEDIKVHGNEVKLNSIYDPDGDDRKHKLWCNPSGESKKGSRENGVYHCWISNKKGTLIGLVMDVDKCSMEEAYDRIGSENIVDLDAQLEEFFGTKKPAIVAAPAVEHTKVLTMPEGVALISGLPTWSRAKRDAEVYLQGRKIPCTGLYVGVEGDYRDRVVIPYYDQDGNLIYYNGRYIGTYNKATKYKGPDKKIGVGKGDVIFMPEWAPPGCTLHVTEGEFDAIVLRACGLWSCAVGGSNLSYFQQKTLKPYNVRLCGDVDKPGAGAVFRSGNAMLSVGFKNITFVRPPKGYKDWNELYLKLPGELVARYIEDKAKPFDLITSEQLFAENV